MLRLIGLVLSESADLDLSVFCRKKPLALFCMRSNESKIVFVLPRNLFILSGLVCSLATGCRFFYIPSVSRKWRNGQSWK